MPETPSDTPEGPDVRAIRHLVRLMKKYDLTALDLVEGHTKIRLRRQGPGHAAGTFVPAMVAQPVPQAPAPAAPAPAPTPAAPAAPVGVVIESPMVGTFYASMSPDTPPFVSVGSKVRADMTVCIIEAMKVFTDIPAGVNGTIAEILVKSGQPVEFGQPLFRVTPA